MARKWGKTGNYSNAITIQPYEKINRKDKQSHQKQAVKKTSSKK